MYVARDPYARGEYHRRAEGPGQCDWCGQVRKRLYSYTWEGDDNPGRGRRDSHRFCNRACHEQYYGG